MKNIDKDPPHNMPTYPPSWIDADSVGAYMWVVYDQKEGFQPAWALIFADDATQAEEVAEVLSRTDLATGQGLERPRLSGDSETLVVRQIRYVGPPDQD